MGILHPDLLRVLGQDGFSYNLLDPTAPRATHHLTQHLCTQNMALLLIARRENGNLHWVLTDAHSDGNLRVGDSLKIDVYTEPTADFIKTCVLTIVATEPEGDDGRESFDVAYRDSIGEMAKVRARINARGED